MTFMFSLSSRWLLLFSIFNKEQLTFKSWVRIICSVYYLLALKFNISNTNAYFIVHIYTYKYAQLWKILQFAKTFGKKWRNALKIISLYISMYYVMHLQTSKLGFTVPDPSLLFITLDDLLTFNEFTTWR